MNIRLKNIVVLFLFFILISGCSGGDSVKYSSTGVFTPTFDTENVATSTETTSPSTVVTSISTPDSDRLETRSIEMVSLDEFDLNGLLVWRDHDQYEVHIADFLGKTIIELPQVYGGLIPSPDRHSLVYGNLDRHAIVIIDALGREQMLFSDEEERYTVMEWPAEHYIVFSYQAHEREETWEYSVTRILDLNTMIFHDFLPEYPDLLRMNNYLSGWRYQSSPVNVSPTLEFIVYPVDSPNPSAIPFTLKLIDSEDGNEITQIFELTSLGGFFLQDPVWFSDGKSFLTSAALRFAIEDFDQQPITLGGEALENAYFNVNDEIPYLGGYEIIRVWTTGEVERLSYLTTTEPAMQSLWVLSPDDTKVAFWLTQGLNYGLPITGELAVLDIQTGEVVSFCLEGGYEPIWSPDGRFIALNQINESNIPLAVYIIDLEEGRMALFEEDAAVSAWLSEGE